MGDIVLECPNCGKRLEVDDKEASLQVPCPVCGRLVQMPGTVVQQPPAIVSGEGTVTSSPSEAGAGAGPRKPRTVFLLVLGGIVALAVVALVTVFGFAGVIVFHERKGESDNAAMPAAMFGDPLLGALKARAENGDATAQLSLGGLYAEGAGVTQDMAEAVKWWRKAAEHGDATAQFNLGVCYDFGNGVPKDAVEAVKWYRTAAEQGNASAQNNLGGCYAKGAGVPKDFAEAVQWYRKAAEQGDASAQNNLGGCYEKGDGVPKDAVEAAKWYRKAAEQGHAGAQFNLSVCYYDGKGVPKDHAEAQKWWNIAVAQGLEAATEKRDKMEKQMTPGLAVEGQGLSREFKPKVEGSGVQSLKRE